MESFYNYRTKPPTHGGKVSWNEADNSLTYISSHSRPIEKFYIDENRKIVTEKPAAPCGYQRQQRYVIRDIRNGILHTYPIGNRRTILDERGFTDGAL